MDKYDKTIIITITIIIIVIVIIHNYFRNIEYFNPIVTTNYGLTCKPHSTLDCASNNYRIPGTARADSSCETCPSGEKPNEHKTDCIDCLVGTAGTGGTCTLCLPGKEPNEHKTDCIDCIVCSSTQYFTGSCHNGGSSNNKTCLDCPVCNDATQYSTGSCGGNFNDKTCHDCPCGQIPNQERTSCRWDPYNWYQFHGRDLEGECTKITGNIYDNYWTGGWAASSFLVPRNSQIALYTYRNWEGKCFSIANTSSDAPMYDNVPPDFDNNVQAIRINTVCP